MDTGYNEKQLHILAIAEALFAMQGYHGTSVRDIAQKANVNVAMISYYFGSKERLLEAIFENRISIHTLRLENLVSDKEKSPFEKFDIIIEHYVDRLEQNTNFFRLMQTLQFNQENLELTEIIFKSKSKNYQLIAGLVAEGQKQGLFCNDIEVPFLMSTMVGASNQIFLGKEFYRRQQNMQNINEPEFNQLLKEKMKKYLKKTFKAILTYEL